MVAARLASGRRPPGRQVVTRGIGDDLFDDEDRKQRVEQRVQQRDAGERAGARIERGGGVVATSDVPGAAE